VRTAQDSLMVVPNGKLSDSTINNLGSRRLRQMKTTLPITAGATPESLESFAGALSQLIVKDEAFVAERTDIGVSGITEGGITIEISTYLRVSTSSAERATRHKLLLDIVQLAEVCGLTLGAGMQPAGTSPTAS
jgi:MscS family membrane protein